MKRCLVLCLFVTSQALANDQAMESLRAYFVDESQQIAASSLASIQSREDWERQCPALKEQLLEMLGLSPLPERTPLHAKVTRTTTRDGITVENLYFQSRPGLYVTANLYRPEQPSGRLPAIVYVCGHARVKEDSVSYGNKTAYHHHGAWFARNGYVCLTLDTIQLGELEGIHHGTYRENMWWWLNRGYTPAGVEAWNAVRALDYLETRDEVDPQRIGITGRSGGGAYSWWTAAIDDRIKVAVPVAGITDLQNHVVDGTVEGHCDCMFMVNTYRWDYDKVAAMLAPRPLLISNTDRDSIFPLDGVYRTYVNVRRIYEMYGAGDDIALHITAGPHQDTQELRVHAFRWFNHYLKNDDALITDAAHRVFEPAELKVFDHLPTDEITTTVHESFVAPAAPIVGPIDETTWENVRTATMSALRSRVFRGWPTDAHAPSLTPIAVKNGQGLRLREFDFESQPHVPLRLYVLEQEGAAQPAEVQFLLQDDEDWQAAMVDWNPQAWRDGQPESAQPTNARAVVLFSPRGLGPFAWQADERTWTQIRRRFYLLGQSLDGMRVYDVRRAIQALRTLTDLGKVRVRISGADRLGAIGLYAALFEPDMEEVTLRRPPTSDREDPYLLNVRRFADLPDIALMAANQMHVRLEDVRDTTRWQTALSTWPSLHTQGTFAVARAKDE